MINITSWYGKSVFQANGHKKQGGVAISISDNIAIKLKLLRRDKECYYILIRVKVHQEEI